MYLKTRFRTGFFGSIRIVVVDCKFALSSLITSISGGFAERGIERGNLRSLKSNNLSRLFRVRDGSENPTPTGVDCSAQPDRV